MTFLRFNDCLNKSIVLGDVLIWEAKKGILRVVKCSKVACSDLVLQSGVVGPLQTANRNKYLLVSARVS